MTERMVTITMQSAEYLLKLHKSNPKAPGMTPNMWKFIQEDLWNGIQVAKGNDKSMWDRKPTRRAPRTVTAKLPEKPPF